MSQGNDSHGNGFPSFYASAAPTKNSHTIPQRGVNMNNGFNVSPNINPNVNNQTNSIPMSNFNNQNNINNMNTQNAMNIPNISSIPNLDPTINPGHSNVPQNIPLRLQLATKRPPSLTIATQQPYGMVRNTPKTPLSATAGTFNGGTASAGPVFQNDLLSPVHSQRPMAGFPRAPSNGLGSSFEFNSQSAYPGIGNFNGSWFSPVSSPTTRSPPKKPFQYQASPLPTHYETHGYDLIPPSRAAAPAPYFVGNRGPAKTHKRGKSVGVISQEQNYYGPSFMTQFPGQVHHQNQPYNIEIFDNDRIKDVAAPKLRAVSSAADLAPVANREPLYRRVSPEQGYISPLKALTSGITTTYSLCRTEFNYQHSRNPRRALTKPSEPRLNNNADNVNSDYILYVNDVLGTEESRKYLVLDIVGHGTFGQVVKCQNLLNKEILAVKIIRSDPVFLNQSLTEVTILELINKKIDPFDKHHFLRIKDKFTHKNHLCIAFELLGNNLYELIKQNNFVGLEMPTIKIFARQLLSSLIVLKTFKIVHCDLKPENILLVSPDKQDLKIIDFGSACHERSTIYTYIQSRYYRSPEVILGLPYTCAIDMWSFGCIIAELFLGLPLFPGSDEYNQLCRIIDIFGYPASWMIEMGKNSPNYLEKIPAYPSSNSFNNQSGSQSSSGSSTAFYKHKLKSREKYAKETNTQQKPYTSYFKSNNFAEILLNYEPSQKHIGRQKKTNIINSPIPKSKASMEKERNDRLNLLQFLKGILNINPLERWTPQQAIAHPFVNNLPYNENWVPPGVSANVKQYGNPSNQMNVSTGSNHRQRISNMHRRGQLSTSAIGANSKLMNGGMSISFNPNMKNSNQNMFTMSNFDSNSDLDNQFAPSQYSAHRQEQNSSGSSAAFTFGSSFNSAANTPSSDNITSFKFPLQ